MNGSTTVATLLFFLAISHYLLHRRLGQLEERLAARLATLESRGLRTLTEVRETSDKTAVVADTLSRAAVVLPAPPEPWRPGDPERRLSDTPQAFPLPPLPPLATG